MHKRDILKIKVIQSNVPNDRMLHKRQRNVTKEVRLTKQAYYQNSFNEHTGDSRRTWQTINELTSRKSGKTSVTSRKISGLMISDTQETSIEFNNHFPTIGPKLANEIDSDSGDYQTSNYENAYVPCGKELHLNPSSLLSVGINKTSEISDTQGGFPWRNPNVLRSFTALVPTQPCSHNDNGGRGEKGLFPKRLVSFYHRNISTF